jgi:serine/alanine adding enzyme
MIETMGFTIKTLSLQDTQSWDGYVEKHRDATVYHLSGWSRMIEGTYAQKAYLLAAVANDGNATSDNEETERIVGIFPIFKFRDLTLSNSFISMPFSDMGGTVADSALIRRSLIMEAIFLGDKFNAKKIEMRSTERSKSESDFINSKEFKKKLYYHEESRRYRMLLKLPTTSKELIDGYKSKLRSQIRRPIKSGFVATVGQSELLEDFYTVFAENMRDLGSPVHSKKLFVNLFKEFTNKANIFVVHGGKGPVAASLAIGFRNVLHNPWASSLRKYSKFSPNMLLYWKMLEFACDNGFRFFDFGRSSIGEGTYKFKKQWGASPVQLPWQYISIGKDIAGDSLSENNAFLKAGEIWKRFPIFLTKLIGPHLRKYIGL